MGRHRCAARTPRRGSWRSTPRAARALDGVRAVLTHADVPGAQVHRRQPPQGPARAGLRPRPPPRRAGRGRRRRGPRDRAPRRRADRRRLRAAAGAAAASRPRSPPDAPALHPDGNTVRAVRIVHGDPDAPLARDAVTVSATYEVGMQDQAFLGPEAGLARPLGDGGVELEVATQWLHQDREQVAAALGLPEEQRAARARRRRRRVRRPRGHLGARARLPARARHRAAGEDELRAARSRSSATCTATPRGSSTSTPRRRTGGCCACGRGCCSTAAPTRRARRP